MVLCALLFLAESWIWHDTKPQKRFGPRLHGEWAADALQRFFEGLHIENQWLLQWFLLTAAGQGKSQPFHHVATWMLLHWSCQIPGESVVSFSFSSYPHQTSGGGRKVKCRENKRWREALADREPLYLLAASVLQSSNLKCFHFQELEEAS